MTKKRQRPQPLAPPPQSSALRSRKRARQVTTLFHKYSQQRDLAVARARAGGCSVESLETLTSRDKNEKGDCVHGNLRINGNICSEDACSDSNKHVSKKAEHDALLREVEKWEDKISAIGGREEYQRASQMNTSFFSTSKWVIGVLGRWGWLDGVPLSVDHNRSDRNDHDGSDPQEEEKKSINNHQKKRKKEKLAKRDLRLLEIGAINTQLIDIAARTRRTFPSSSHGDHHNYETIDAERNNSNRITKERSFTPNKNERVHRLQVHAIDLRSTDPRIHQIDFFQLPLPPPSSEEIYSSHSINPSSKNHLESSQILPRQHLPFDVVVNSMVINCLTTPSQRGRMLSLCYHHLRPGGVCFLMLPKLCLSQSKFMSMDYFVEIIEKGVGFEVLKSEGKMSPKVAFFVLRRPQPTSAARNMEKVKKESGNTDGIDNRNEIRKWNEKYTCVPKLHRGKKFRNTFAVVLAKEEVLGHVFYSKK